MHTTVHKRYYDVLRAQEAKQRVARRLALGDSLAKATLTQGNRNSTRQNADNNMYSEEDGMCTYADLRVVTPRVLDPIQTLHLSFTALRTITELTHCNRAITALHPNFLQLESLEVLILRHNRLQTLCNLLPQSVPHLPPLTTHTGKRKHNTLSGPRGCVRLRQLLLAHNDLRDLASTDIPRLTSLEYLSLAHNKLTSVVHTAQQLRKLHSLRYLDCSESPICEEENYREYMIAHLPQLDVLDRQVITQEERQAAAVRYEDTIKGADTTNSSENNEGKATTTKRTKGSPWKEMSVCARLLEKQHAAYLNAQVEAAAHAALVQERAVQEVTESKAAFHAVWALAAPKAAVTVVSQQQLNTAPVLSTSRRRSREGITSTTLAGNTTTTTANAKAKPSNNSNGRTTAQQQQQQMLLGTSMTAELRPQSEDGVVVRLPCQTVESLLQKKPLQLSPHTDSPAAIHDIVPHESVLYDALLGRTAAVAEKTCKTWRVTQPPAKQKKNKSTVNESDVQSSGEEGEEEVARVAVEEAEALQEMAGVVRHSAELLRSLRREQCVTKANTSTSNTTTTNTIANNAEANATSAGEGGEESTQMIELTAEQKAHYCALHDAQAAMIPAPWLCDDLTQRPTHITDKEDSESRNTISHQQQQQQEVQLYLVQILQQLFCTQELRAMENYFGLSEVLTAVQQQPQLQQQQQQQMLLALARSGSTQSSSGTSSTTHRSATTTPGAAAANEAAATAGARKKASVRARNRGHTNANTNSSAKGADGITGAGSGGNQAAVSNASTGGNSASNINNSSGSITAAMSWAQDTQLLQLMTHAMTTPAPASESSNTATSSMQRGMTSGLSQPGVVGPYVPSSIDAFMNVLQKDSGAWSLDTKALLRALCTAHNVPCNTEGALGCDKAAGLTLRSTTLNVQVANESNAADETQGEVTHDTAGGTAVRFILPSAEDTKNTDGVASRTSVSVNEQTARNTLPVSRGSLRNLSRKGSKKSVTDTVSADTEKVSVVNKTSNVKSPTAGLWLSVNNLLGALVCYVPFVQSRLAYFQAQSLRGVRQASQAAAVKEWFDRAQAVQEHLRRLQAALQRASRDTDSSNGDVIVPHMLLLERKTHRVGDFFAKKQQATMYIGSEGCNV